MSYGAGFAVGLRNDTTRRAIVLALRNLTPRSQRVLTLTGLDRVFTIDQCGDPHDHQPPELTR
jgi:anti-anti-sigma regulatory factor